MLLLSTFFRISKNSLLYHNDEIHHFFTIFSHFFYFSISTIIYLSMQQFSPLKLEVFSWNSPTSLIRTIPRQASFRISTHSLLNSTSKPISQIQCKILHTEIILFTNNSQAILSIPYLAMLNLISCTSTGYQTPTKFQ